MFVSQHRVILLGLLLTIAVTSADVSEKGWWEHTVFYQIYPRSFLDLDATVAGVGDLIGITSKLDYLKESGIGAIWLSPINRSPMVDFGYDIADFKDIDKTFGTLLDFDALLKRAKELGLKVILDLVPNHTSDEHYWFQESVRGNGKYADYYIWADGKNKDDKTPPNNWRSVFSGSAWTYSDIRQKWYFHQFDKRQPDLNYRNSHVQQEMKEIIEYWLRKGVDGFRVDAVPHLFESNYTDDEPNSWKPGVTPDDYDYLIHVLTKDQPETYELVQSWRNILDEYARLSNTNEKVMMTEAYTTFENTIKFYKFGSHIPFNFDFIMDVNSQSNATAFKAIIDKWKNAVPEGGVLNWVIGNHDRSRVATRFPGRPDQMTMLAMVLPGVAVTYYGEEIGMVDKSDISWEDTQDPQACNAGRDKYQSKTRDPVRTPFQWNNKTNAGFSNASKTWLPVHENFKEVNLEQQKEASESHYHVYRKLTALRQNSDVLKSGSLTAEVINDNVLCVLRKKDKEVVTLLINFFNQTVELNLIKSMSDLSGFKDGAVAVASVGSGLKDNETIQLGNFSIPARASVVFLAKAETTDPGDGNAASSMYVTSLQILLSTFLWIMMWYK